MIRGLEIGRLEYRVFTVFTTGINAKYGFYTPIHGSVRVCPRKISLASPRIYLRVANVS